MKAKHLFITFLFLLSALILNAQGEGNVLNIYGTVKNQQNEPVENAIVEIVVNENSQHFYDTTDYNGDFYYSTFYNFSNENTAQICVYVYSDGYEEFDTCKTFNINLNDTINAYFEIFLLDTTEYISDCIPYFNYEIMDYNTLRVAFHSEVPLMNATIDYGDGFTEDFNGNTVHFYQDTGTYYVTVSGQVEGCENTGSFSLWVYAYPMPEEVDCYADFYYTLDTTDPSLLTAKFTNFSYFTDTANVSFVWDFGDGNTSTEFNPTHRYQQSGEYVVSLTMENNNCSNYFEIPIWVGNPDSTWFIEDECSALFYTEYTDSMTVEFSDISWPGLEHQIISYFWNFGDGTTSILPNPEHIYADTGNYLVSLTIQTDGGCMSTFEQYVYILPNAENIESGLFYPNYDTTTKGHKVKFHNLSRGGTWVWDFGDAKGYTQKGGVEIVIHDYADTGTYHVELLPQDKGNSGYAMDIRVTNGDVEILRGYALLANNPQPSGVEKVSNAQFNIYPIPMTNYLTINSKDNILQIEIYSVDGKVVKSLNNLNSKNITINTNDLQNGLYMIKVKTEEGIYYKKAIK